MLVRHAVYVVLVASRWIGRAAEKVRSVARELLLLLLLLFVACVAGYSVLLQVSQAVRSQAPWLESLVLVSSRRCLVLGWCLECCLVLVWECGLALA